jgi:hypothetical protein
MLGRASLSAFDVKQAFAASIWIAASQLLRLPGRSTKL